MKKIVGLITSVLMAVMILITGCGINRLEPGVAAVKIDYANGGQRTSIPTGGYITYNPVTERIAEYPVGQQSLVMVRREGEGKVKGDDSVEVRDQHGIPVHIDTTVFWRVDPEKIADLFQLRPNVPLVGKDINDGIDGIVVRRLVRGALQDVAANFTYGDIFGPRRAEYVMAVVSRLNQEFPTEFLIFDRFQMGEVYLDQAQQDAFSLQATAQQQAITAQAQVETARQHALATVAEAEGAATATRLVADAQAYTTLKREEAMAQSPHVIAYEVAIHQADHQPQVTGSQPLVQVRQP